MRPVNEFAMAYALRHLVVTFRYGALPSISPWSRRKVVRFLGCQTYTNEMMSAGEDMSLLREYAERGVEQAFATLVSRHVDLVYSVAMRQVRDPHLAEEITQNVFIILARKGKSLSPKTILPGWLCRTARYVSSNAVRTHRHRQFREQGLKMQSILDETGSGAWSQIAPLLDEALNCLGEKEHDAVVLRFFDGKELKQVGAALGTTEDAARMRVNRGLERLRVFFAKKGVTLSAAAIAGAVTSNSVQAAPTGLAAAVTAATLSECTFTGAATIAAMRTVTMTTLQKTLVGGLVAVAVAAGLYQTWQISRLREQNHTLRQQQVPLTGEIQHLTQERDALANRLAAMRDKDQLQSRKERLELMSLRGRVRQLAEELGQLKASANEETSGSKSKPTDADSILFSASLTNRVSSGQTLVVGGWSIEGVRGYLLLTPAIRRTDGISDAWFVFDFIYISVRI